MKTLIYGTGTIGSLYAYLLYTAGKDVTILARNEQFNFIKKNGIVLLNEFTGEKMYAPVKVVNKLNEEDKYDLVVVAIRSNMHKPVLSALKLNKNIKNILFLGNLVSGFNTYIDSLPREKLVFGFGRAGGGKVEHVIHYVDREDPKGKRMPIVFGEIDNKIKPRTRQIEELFESSGIPVEVNSDIDGWLKYHIALVLPMCTVLIKNGCNNYKLADNRDDIKLCLKAVKEMGTVFGSLGFKRQPFKLNLFYWMPEFLVIKIFQQILKSKFAEIGFAMHAKAASDEFSHYYREFKKISSDTSVKTPILDQLSHYLEKT